MLSFGVAIDGTGIGKCGASGEGLALSHPLPAFPMPAAKPEGRDKHADEISDQFHKILRCCDHSFPIAH